MNSELITRVTVFAVGVEDYKHLRPLQGHSTDVEKIHELLVLSSTTALFSESQFIKILNPTSEELRSHINSYTLGRSASGDILLFYFSGHGVSIGRDDFGFCTTDTVNHPGVDAVLTFTVVKFSDLLATISIMGIIPIVIIDACYSGSAGSALISPHEAISTMHNEIEKTNASNHALLCSCSDLQSSLDSSKGGLFSRSMFQVINTGIPGLRTGPYTIGLKDIYQPLTNLIEKGAHDSVPRLYLGSTLPDFPLAKNVNFSPQSYSFVGHLKCVIDELWNNGNERLLSRREILDLCGQGAYGNHKKLSLEPWSLVENSPDKKRQLTERGRLFAQGKLKIPRTIEKDPVTEKWMKAPGSVDVDIHSV